MPNSDLLCFRIPMTPTVPILGEVAEEGEEGDSISVATIKEADTKLLLKNLAQAQLKKSCLDISHVGTSRNILFQSLGQGLT